MSNTRVILRTNMADLVGAENLPNGSADLVIELDHVRAPKSVENFLKYVKAGAYTNTIFHRVIQGFMIQGGGFDRAMQQQPTEEPIANEANNGLDNDKYTIAMARTSDPHSASRQFFINQNNNDFLNHAAPTPNGWGYAVFGKVVTNVELVDLIAGQKTGNLGFHQNVPKEPIIILDIVVEGTEQPATE
jgi:peptidyl-prolyl cis-trans isomerase B (cyclophilin B)